MTPQERTPRSLLAAFLVLFCVLGALAFAGVGTGSESTSEQARERAAGGETEADRERDGEEGEEGESFQAFNREHPANSRLKLPVAVIREKVEHGKEAEREATSGPAQQQVDARAFPRAFVADADAAAARRAYLAKPSRLGAGAFRRGSAALQDRAQAAGLANPWQPLGPVTPNVPAQVTYTGAPTQNSGRTTASVISPTCGQPGQGCRLWIGAAGGGVWRTDDATAAKPVWTAVDQGLQSTAIGSLTLDPGDPNTIYAGTGEPNASSDSEAGLGVFKSTDGGDHWTQLPGSVTSQDGSGPGTAIDRSVASMAIDPRDPQHLYIGTALARHGSSSSNGGRRTPPNAPRLGVYESTDGGQSFALAFAGAADSDVDEQSPAEGTDLFTGGVNRIELDPNDPDTLYAALFGYGIWRLHGADDPVQAFATIHPASSVDPANVDPAGDRTEFDLVSVGGGKTRAYVGDSSEGGDTFGAYGHILRTDDVAAAGVTPGDPTATPPTDPANIATGAARWRDLSNDVVGSPGFVSSGWCQGQCTYDAFVVADQTNPNVVFVGGSMNYDELFGAPGITPGRTNGRAVIRSTNGGGLFTDMTNDTTNPKQTGIHPDQHTLVINPSDPGQFFEGSDGGMIRSDGQYSNDSARCGSRGLTGAEATLCGLALSSVPRRLDSISDGLDTLQFQNVSVSAARPLDDVIGGTQDNGTWAYTGSPTWFESIGGDGGNSAISDAGGFRVHTYYGPTQDVNYNANDPDSWLYISQPLDERFGSGAEQFSFYVPEIADPKVPTTIFTAGEFVYRTTDAGGPRAELEQHCRETSTTVGDGSDYVCGDWKPLGGLKSGRVATTGPLGSAANYVVALERAASDTGTLWIGRRRGGLFISKNADAADPEDVQFADITGSSPDRFVSGITVDPTDPNHAWVSFSGYSQYTSAGRDQGHVFEVRFDPGTRQATWTDRSYDLGKAPITDIARDDATGDLYASTDFGVLRLPAGATSWQKAAEGLPIVAVYGLTASTSGRVLYAATHGRGIYRVALGAAPRSDTPSEPPASGPAPGTKPTPKPASKPIKQRLGSVKASTRRLSGGRRTLTLALTVGKPAKVRIRVSLGGRSLATRTVTVRKAGRLTVHVTVRVRGKVSSRTRLRVTLQSGSAVRRVSVRP